MNAKQKRDIIITISSVLAIMGAIILSHFGFPPLLLANEMSENPQCGDILVCERIPLQYATLDSEDNMIALTGILEFSSKGTFSAFNKIDYFIDVQISNPELVKEIYFIILDESFDFEEFITIPTSKVLDVLKEEQRLIDLIKISETQYTRIGSWALSEPSDITLSGIIVEENGVLDVLEETKVIVTLESQQIKNESIANIESRIMNKTFLGLTWIGVGLAPLLLGADLLARVFLKD